jgi:hypothetical protein
MEDKLTTCRIAFPLTHVPVDNISLLVELVAHITFIISGKCKIQNPGGKHGVE